MPKEDLVGLSPMRYGEFWRVLWEYSGFQMRIKEEAANPVHWENDRQNAACARVCICEVV